MQRKADKKIIIEKEKVHTSFIRKGSPSSLTVSLNMGDELLVFFLCPCSFLQPFCSTTRRPYHSWFLNVIIEARVKRKRERVYCCVLMMDRSYKERTGSFDKNIKATIDSSYWNFVHPRYSTSLFYIFPSHILILLCVSLFPNFSYCLLRSRRRRKR